MKYRYKTKFYNMKSKSNIVKGKKTWWYQIRSIEVIRQKLENSFKLSVSKPKLVLWFNLIILSWWQNRNKIFLIIRGKKSWIYIFYKLIYYLFGLS